MRQLPKNIALVGNTLSSGGAEKVQARLSFYFENQGINVHHIIITDEVTYPYAGKLFNMGLLKNTSNGPFNKMKRLMALKKYLKENAIECVIDFRVKTNFFQERIIANWVYNIPYIITVRSYDTSYYFPKDINKARTIFKKAKNIITVSKALEQKIKREYHYTNVTTIYNPIDFAEVAEKAKETNSIKGHYILAVGRMVKNIKQFDHLIEAFANSKAIEKNYRLVLLGEGEDKEKYQTLAKELGVADKVLFPAFTANPFPLYKNARCTVLTSKYEGFPNVLLESLSVGTPVISYNCKSGPSEIVKSGENGLLISHNDSIQLTQAISKMVVDETFYSVCKKGALQSISHCSLNKIGDQWVSSIKDATV